MPTKAQRIYVPVTPELMEALDEFTKVSGVAKSQLLAQLISETAPVIRAMTEAFKVAKKSPSQAASVLQDMVTEAHIGVAQLQLDIQSEKRKHQRKKLRKAPKRD